MKSNFTVEKLDKDSLSQVVKVNSNSDVMLIVYTLDIVWWKWHFISVIFFLKTHILSNQEKISDKHNLRYSTKCLIGTPQNCQDQQKKVWEIVLAKKSFKRYDG